MKSPEVVAIRPYPATVGHPDGGAARFEAVDLCLEVGVSHLSFMGTDPACPRNRHLAKSRGMRIVPQFGARQTYLNVEQYREWVLDRCRILADEDLLSGWVVVLIEANDPLHQAYRHDLPHLADLLRDEFGVRVVASQAVGFPEAPLISMPGMDCPSYHWYRDRRLSPFDLLWMRIRAFPGRNFYAEGMISSIEGDQNQCDYLRAAGKSGAGLILPFMVNPEREGFREMGLVRYVDGQYARKPAFWTLQSLMRENVL